MLIIKNIYKDRDNIESFDCFSFKLDTYCKNIRFDILDTDKNELKIGLTVQDLLELKPILGLIETDFSYNFFSINNILWRYINITRYIPTGLSHRTSNCSSPFIVIYTFENNNTFNMLIQRVNPIDKFNLFWSFKNGILNFNVLEFYRIASYYTDISKYDKLILHLGTVCYYLDLSDNVKKLILKMITLKKSKAFDYMLKNYLIGGV